MPHLDLHLLHAALEGDVPAKLLVRQLLAHLGELCPDCREAVEGLSLAQQGESSVLPAAGRESTVVGGGVFRLGDPRSVSVLDRGQVEATDWAKRVRRERRKARADVRELLRLPTGERRARIEKAHSRFRSRAVAELLLEESRRLVREQPAEARDLASLVDLVLLWTPGALGEDWARDLGVRAQASIANSLRVELELRAADRAFAEVRARMARDVVGESVHAEVASLEASLRLEQGRFEEARRLLDLAMLIYRAGEDEQALVPVLAQQAMVEYFCDDLAAAAALQRQVLEALAGEEDSRLYVASVVNLGIFLVDGGEPAEAAALLRAQEPVLHGQGAWEWPEAKVLRGRVSLAQGDSDAAEQLFLAAREELVESGSPVRAAAASLDLALLYLERGETAELRRTARVIGSIFESAELENEALAAMVLFQKAVEAEAVTVQAVRAWRRQLEISNARDRRKPPVQ